MNKDSKPVRIKSDYADAIKVASETSDPKVSQTAMLNHILEKGGIKTILKKGARK
jgi:hypothetical protein